MHVALDAAGLAHDSNNYLQIILMKLEGLTGKFGPDFDAVTRINEIRKVIFCLMQMNQSVLRDYSVAVEDEAECKTSPNEAILEAIRLARTVSSNGALVFTRFNAENRPVAILAAHLQLVVFNVLKNALDAVPAKGGKILVETSSHLSPTTEPSYDSLKFFRIRIIDNGPGIPFFVRDKLFTSCISRKENGHGVGLSYSQKIMNNYGGGISLENRSNGGTIAVIHLPYS